MYARKPEPRFTTVVLTLLIIVSIIATMTMMGCVENDYGDALVQTETALQDISNGISELEEQVKILQEKVTELQDDTESTPEELEEAIADLMSQIPGLMKKAEELRDSLNDLNWDFLKGEKGKKEEGNSSLDAVETQLTAMTTDLEALLGELKKEQEEGTTDEPVEDDPAEQTPQQPETNTPAGTTGTGTGNGGDNSDDSSSGGTASNLCPGCNRVPQSNENTHVKCPNCQGYFCVHNGTTDHGIIDYCGHWFCTYNNQDAAETGHSYCDGCGQCTYGAVHTMCTMPNCGKCTNDGHTHNTNQTEVKSTPPATDPVCDKCGLIINSGTHFEMTCGHVRCASEPEHTFNPCGIHCTYAHPDGENHPADQSCN